MGITHLHIYRLGLEDHWIPLKYQITSLDIVKRLSAATPFATHEGFLISSGRFPKFLNFFDIEQPMFYYINNANKTTMSVFYLIIAFSGVSHSIHIAGRFGKINHCKARKN